VADIGLAAGGYHLGRVEAGVTPQRQRSARPRGADPTERFGQKAGRPPPGVGIAAPQTEVDHIAGARHRREHWVVAADMVVRELGAPLLVQPVGLHDAGVDIDGKRAHARANASPATLSN
jgi:hypothetical protein